MAMRILIYVLLLYLLYTLIIRPIFQGFRNDGSATQNSSKINPNAKKQEEGDKGEYIDYEEVK